MKKIYILRHGQTEYNRKGILQGRAIDAPLNATGISQSLAFYTKYKDIPFDLVLTSELQRSIQSVQAFIDKGVPHQVDPRITEFSWGNNEGLPLSDIVVGHYKKMLGEWYAGNLSARIPGGESGQELQQRVRDFIGTWRQSGQANLLICTHGRTLKMLIVELLGFELRKMEDIRHSNAALYLLHQNGHAFELVKTNDLDHLPPELRVDAYWDK